MLVGIYSILFLSKTYVMCINTQYFVTKSNNIESYKRLMHVPYDSDELSDVFFAVSPWDRPITHNLEEDAARSIASTHECESSARVSRKVHPCQVC